MEPLLEGAPMQVRPVCEPTSPRGVQDAAAQQLGVCRVVTFGEQVGAVIVDVILQQLGDRTSPFVDQPPREELLAVLGSGPRACYER